MQRSSISVVIPAYNARRFLRQAVDSVWQQSRPPSEVIVVDDCSTDDTGEIARQAGAQVIRLPENGGTYVALNAGIRASHGELVAHQAADDVWHPDHLAHVAPLLERFPEAGVAFSGVRYTGARSGAWVPTKLPDREPADAFWPSFTGTVVPHITAIMRREIWEQADGYEESRRAAMDFDFWLRVARISPFVASHHITADYRWHEAQISSRPLEQLRSVYWARNRLLTTLAGESNPELHCKALRRLRAIWVEDMQDAAWRGERSRGRLLLEMAGRLPGIPWRDRMVQGLRLWTPGRLRPLGRRLIPQFGRPLPRPSGETRMI